MKKVFCDGCNVEVSQKEVGGNPRLTAWLNPTSALRKTAVEVIIRGYAACEPGDYCDSCILDALGGLDIRPQAAVTYNVWLPIQAAVCDGRLALVHFSDLDLDGRPTPADNVDNVSLVSLRSDTNPEEWRQRGAIQVMHVRPTAKG